MSLLTRLLLLSAIGVFASLAGCTGSGPTTCTLAKVADFPVTFTSGNLPTIVIKIDGHQERMVLDTGAASTFLMPEAYENLRGMPLVRVYGFYGTALAATWESIPRSWKTFRLGTSS